MLLREQQYASCLDPVVSLEIAKNCILGKVYNARWVLERCIRDHEMQVDAEKIKMASEKLKHALELIQVCESKEQLRGFEGEAASVYFGVFDEMILQQKKDFVFHGRSKRPPMDNMNAMLSFVYTLLTNTIASALECVGIPLCGISAYRKARKSFACVGYDRGIASCTGRSFCADIGKQKDCEWKKFYPKRKWGSDNG